MPSPKNQWGLSERCGLEPFLTYRPFSSGGSAPRTPRSKASTSSITGAKLPCNHHGLLGSIAMVVPGVVVAVVVGAVVGDTVVLLPLVVLAPAPLPLLSLHAAISAASGTEPAPRSDQRTRARRLMELPTGSV